jgi:hypothetical protein
VGREAAAGDLLVGEEHLFAKRFEEHGVPANRVNRGTECRDEQYHPRRKGWSVDEKVIAE